MKTDGGGEIAKRTEFGGGRRRFKAAKRLPKRDCGQDASVRSNEEGPPWPPERGGRCFAGRSAALPLHVPVSP